MGLQNIKGTGLDFVYRWVSIDAVERMLALVASETAAERTEGLRLLAMHGDFGLLDAQRAVTCLEALGPGDRGAPDVAHAALLERLRALVAEKERALREQKRGTAGDAVRRAIGKTLDYIDSMRRQGMATRVIDDLVRGRISHAGAASRMRAIVARQKGAWMQNRPALAVANH